jgi:regulator of sigma E protease
MEAIEGRSDKPKEELPPVSAWDKIIVAFAGPLFSFGLAVLFAFVVWGVGRPVRESEKTTIVGKVDKDSPAANLLQPGDRIIEVDNKPVSKWTGMGQSVKWRVVRSEGETIPITVERNGQKMTFQCGFIKEKTKPWQRKSLREILVEPAYTPIIGGVVTNSPAAHAGLRPFDEILAVNGTNLIHPAGLAHYIGQHGPVPLTLSGRREGSPFEVTIVPQVPVGSSNAMVGIIWDDLGGKIDVAHPTVLEQIDASVDAMVSTFGALFSPHSDIKPQHLSGAVNIMNIYYRLFSNEQGWRLVLWFTVIINVNLALLNLLPIPVLDGGHITLALVESVRRRPISARVLSILQTSCAIVIIFYILYITFYDVQDLPWRRVKEKPMPELKFEPNTRPGPSGPAPDKSATSEPAR